jgi:UDP-glucuronate decarboxylase
VIEMTGARSALVELPLPSDDPMQRKPDISLAQKELEWEPGVKLRDGLSKTIDYFRQLSN